MKVDDQTLLLKIFTIFLIRMISYQSNKKDAGKSRGTKHQLLIDKKILGMTWVDYNKAYNMVPHY